MAQSKPGGFSREGRILRLLARDPALGMRLSDLAQGTGLGKSTVHRLLSGLKAAGLVDQDAETRRYHLGFELYLLGQAAAARFGLLELAKPSLQRLVDQTEDTVYLVAHDGSDAICLARLEGAFPIKTLTMNVGDRRPLGIGSSAMALLSFLPDDEIERIVEANMQRYKQFPFFDLAGVFAAVEATRRQGYALTDGIIIAGLQAVGVPIMDARGRPVAAITVGAIAERMRPERRANIVAAIQREVRRIETRLNQGHPPGHAQKAGSA